MRGKCVALSFALVAACSMAAAPATAAEQCSQTPAKACLITEHFQYQLFFTPSNGGNGTLLVDGTGAASLTLFTQDPGGSIAVVAPRGTLTTSFRWAATGEPFSATNAQISGSIPLPQGNYLGLSAIDVSMTVVGQQGDSSHRGSGCSVDDRASAGTGRSRLGFSSGLVYDVELTDAASQIRRYDACLAART